MPHLALKISDLFGVTICTPCSKNNTIVHQLVHLFKNNTLQTGVATPFRCGGKCRNGFVVKFFLSLAANSKNRSQFGKDMINNA